MTIKGKIYYDAASLILLYLLLLIGFCIGLFFIFLSIPMGCIGILFILIILKKINYVIAIDNYFHILSPFLLPKKIPFSELIEIKCERIGLGRSSQILIFVYYHNKDVICKSILLHFTIFKKEKILQFLNTIDAEKVCIESFKMMHIDFQKDTFIVK